MKKLALLIVSILILAGCGSTTVKMDQSSPEATMQSLFNAAKYKDYSKLANLCHPEVDNDGDTEKICRLRENAQESFSNKFSSGKIIKTELDGDKAIVRFTLSTADDKEKEERMFLVKKDGTWYVEGY